MTYAVWVDYPRLKVAAADRLETAMYYAFQYTDEGEVTVRRRNRIIAALTKTVNRRYAPPHWGLEAYRSQLSDIVEVPVTKSKLRKIKKRRK